MNCEKVEPSSSAGALPLSKNQQKKLKRDELWEAGRDARKTKRKEKIKEKKLQKRAAREGGLLASPRKVTAIPNASGCIHPLNARIERPKLRQFVQLPITFILDCSFDSLMNDKERKSLGSQITRVYSDNHKAPYQAHLAISSFGGHLKERFDSVLSGNYHSWKNVRFLDVDFVQAAEQAQTWMQSKQGGKMAGVFETPNPIQPAQHEKALETETVYLTSDSPNTLTKLRPYSTYIIGGLVDRNRHKGVCYKAAMNSGMKTAKLPIGDYLQMASRFVLATNHVAEIMLRWLELGDWGKAFLEVIPKRKGGRLKQTPQRSQHNGSEADCDLSDSNSGEGAYPCNDNDRNEHEKGGVEEHGQEEEQQEDVFDVKNGGVFND